MDTRTKVKRFEIDFGDTITVELLNMMKERVEEKRFMPWATGCHRDSKSGDR